MLLLEWTIKPHLKHPKAFQRPQVHIPPNKIMIRPITAILQSLVPISITTFHCCEEIAWWNNSKKGKHLIGASLWFQRFHLSSWWEAWQYAVWLGAPKSSTSWLKSASRRQSSSGIQEEGLLCTGWSLNIRNLKVPPPPIMTHFVQKAIPFNSATPYGPRIQTPESMGWGGGCQTNSLTTILKTIWDHSSLLCCSICSNVNKNIEYLTCIFAIILNIKIVCLKIKLIKIPI